MRNVSFGIAILSLLFCSATSAPAEVSIGFGIGIGTPHASIGINLGSYPQLVPVPGYPVYYAPRVVGNYFFYDGLYWVYVDDYWYASEWYDGPWWVVQPEYVPVYILRVPVRYYRYPPPYFSGWRRDAPPRWGHLWGPGWERHRRGWDRWDRRHVPPRAPLPVYQRGYGGDRYPRGIEQQQELRREHYRYQPRDKAVRQHFQQPPQGAAPARRDMREEPRAIRPGHQVEPPSRPARSPQQPPPEQRGPAMRQQMEQPRAVPHERQAPTPRGPEQRYQGGERPQEPQGRGYEQRREDERGRER